MQFRTAIIYIHCVHDKALPAMHAGLTKVGRL